MASRFPCQRCKTTLHSRKGHKHRRSIERDINFSKRQQCNHRASDTFWQGVCELSFGVPERREALLLCVCDDGTAQRKGRAPPAVHHVITLCWAREGGSGPGGGKWSSPEQRGVVPAQVGGGGSKAGVLTWVRGSRWGVWGVLHNDNDNNHVNP